MQNLQMPPEYQLEAEQVELLERWVRRGAPGPIEDLGDTEFSRLGDQEYLFAQGMPWVDKKVLGSPLVRSRQFSPVTTPA